ncbi:hypothetical protein GCM10009567_11710 [Rothia amarae]
MSQLRKVGYRLTGNVRHEYSVSGEKFSSSSLALRAKFGALEQEAEEQHEVLTEKNPAIAEP